MPESRISIAPGLVADVGGGDPQQMGKFPAVHGEMALDAGDHPARVVAFEFRRVGVPDALSANDESGLLLTPVRMAVGDGGFFLDPFQKRLADMVAPISE